MLRELPAEDRWGTLAVSREPPESSPVFVFGGVASRSRDGFVFWTLASLAPEVWLIREVIHGFALLGILVCWVACYSNWGSCEICMIPRTHVWLLFLMRLLTHDVTFPVSQFPQSSRIFLYWRMIRSASTARNSICFAFFCILVWLLPYLTS